MGVCVCVNVYVFPCVYECVLSSVCECDTEVETEDGLGGHCGAIEDEVLLEKRETGERSVTGRGPHIVLSLATTKR